MNQSDMPPCVCTAHPSGTNRREWMFVAEENTEFVVFCCRRCSEITRTPVIQVRTLDRLQGRVREQNRSEGRDRGKEEILRQLHRMQRRRQPVVRYSGGLER